MPTYGEISARELKRIALSIKTDKDDPIWHPVDMPRKYDVVLMRTGQSSIICHVGIMVNETHLLHTELSTDAVIVPKNHHTLRSRIVEFRRHTTQL